MIAAFGSPVSRAREAVACKGVHHGVYTPRAPFQAGSLVEATAASIALQPSADASANVVRFAIRRDRAAAVRSRSLLVMKGSPVRVRASAHYKSPAQAGLFVALTGRL
jgi:hypothetical protein